MFEVYVKKHEGRSGVGGRPTLPLPNIIGFIWSAFALDQIFKGKPSHKKADYLWTLSSKGVGGFDQLHTFWEWFC